MSSRFVYGGETRGSEESVEDGAATKPSNILGESENEADDNSSSSDDTNMRTRVSLLQQLKESKDKEYQERKKKMEEQNSAYKLTTKDLDYYNELVDKQRRRIQNEKLQERNDLLAFKKYKHQIASKKSALHRKKGENLKDLKLILKKVLKTKKAKESGISLGYSSADSSDES